MGKCKRCGEGCLTACCCGVLFISIALSFSTIALLILGGVFYTEYSHYPQVLNGAITTPPILLMVTSSTLLIFACCLHCVIRSKSKWVHWVQGIVGALALLAYLSAAGMALSLDEQEVRNEFGTSLSREFRKISPAHPNSASELFNSLQNQLHCCGVNGPSDYNKFSSQEVSKVHCLKVGYKPGCVNALTDAVTYNSGLIGWSTISVVLIHVVWFAVVCIIKACSHKHGSNNLTA